METELNKDNLDEHILKFRAFNKIENSLNNVNILTHTQHIDDDDFVANLAQTWFQQKEASK